MNPSWRKPSRSMGNGNCAQIGQHPAGVLVRDTKQDGLPGRVTLAFSARAWAAFTATLKGER